MNNLVLITSVICTSDSNLCTGIRSLYSHDERFLQTKKTIETVKQKIPGTKIFIVECSKLNEEQNNYLIENSDYFLNLYDNKYVRDDVSSFSKSLGEGSMTIVAINEIINKNIEFDKLIKISGRYWLSDKFNYENFDNCDIVTKFQEYDISAFTALYQLPKTSLINFKNFLENKYHERIRGIGYEQLFYIFIKSEKENIKDINPIGLEGYISTSDYFYSG